MESGGDSHQCFEASYSWHALVDCATWHISNNCRRMRLAGVDLFSAVTSTA